MYILYVNTNICFRPMALTVEKLLNDANTLITRLKDDDYTAERLIGSMQALNNRIDSMKQVLGDFIMG